MNTMDHGLMENGFNEQQITIQLQSSPVFTGFLQLCLLAGIDPIPSRIVVPAGWSPFPETSPGSDVSLTTALVKECCFTLD